MPFGGKPEAVQALLQKINKTSHTRQEGRIGWKRNLEWEKKFRLYCTTPWWDTISDPGNTVSVKLLGDFHPWKPPKAGHRLGAWVYTPSWDYHHTTWVSRQGWLRAMWWLNITERSLGTQSWWWQQVALRRQLAFLTRGNSSSTEGKAIPANMPPLWVTRIKLERKRPLVLNVPIYLWPEKVYRNFHSEENVGSSQQKISFIPEILHNGPLDDSNALRFLQQKF